MVLGRTRADWSHPWATGPASPPLPPSGSSRVAPGHISQCRGGRRLTRVPRRRSQWTGTTLHHLGEKLPLKTGSDAAGWRRHTHLGSPTSKSRRILLTHTTQGPALTERLWGGGFSKEGPGPSVGRPLTGREWQRGGREGLSPKCTERGVTLAPRSAQAGRPPRPPRPATRAGRQPPC